MCRSVMGEIGKGTVKRSTKKEKRMLMNEIYQLSTLFRDKMLHKFLRVNIFLILFNYILHSG